MCQRKNEKIFLNNTIRWRYAIYMRLGLNIQKLNVWRIRRGVIQEFQQAKSYGEAKQTTCKCIKLMITVANKMQINITTNLLFLNKYFDFDIILVCQCNGKSFQFDIE